MTYKWQGNESTKIPFYTPIFTHPEELIKQSYE